MTSKVSVIEFLTLWLIRTGNQSLFIDSHFKNTSEFMITKYNLSILLLENKFNKVCEYRLS